MSGDAQRPFLTTDQLETQLNGASNTWTAQQIFGPITGQSITIQGTAAQPAAIGATGTGSGGFEIAADSNTGNIYLSPRGQSKAHRFNATVGATAQLLHTVTNSGSFTSATIAVIDGATLNSGLTLQASGTGAFSAVSVANQTYTSTLLDQNANATFYGGVFSDSLNGNVAAHNGGWFANADTTGGGAPNVTLAADGSTGTVALKYRHSSGNWTLQSEASGSTTLCDSGGNLSIAGNTIQTGANGVIASYAAGTFTVGNANTTQINLNPSTAGNVNFAYAVTALGGGSAPTLGTIGGSGPATAAQNSWLKVLINGTASFLPVWR